MNNHNIIFNSNAELILSKEQKVLKPFLEEFSRTHFLVWWTAIALILWHRRSIDFDFFCMWNQWTWKEIFNRIKKLWYVLDKWSDLNYLSDEEESECNLFINWVKIQLIDFSRNPFNVKINLKSNNVICSWINSLSLIDLWSLKLFAMMYRKKWKDAVDMYFILNAWISLNNIIKRTNEIFWDLYQLEASLENISENNWDTTEKVEYVIDDHPSDERVSNYLIDQVKSIIKV